ncbi:hypothetical protein CDD81_1978 [Ophiocordyceps australis]|uniref:SET domain-containing protein n=1 Tax=Ophiocordyceps australis TaxID=1399860 RepID=A0A2C5XF02_9HYPO|nr:hypothetical protein CDD81_1978 [Ophiocordyceps australis]
MEHSETQTALLPVLCCPTPPHSSVRALWTHLLETPKNSLAALHDDAHSIANRGAETECPDRCASCLFASDLKNDKDDVRHCNRRNSPAMRAGGSLPPIVHHKSTRPHFHNEFFQVSHSRLAGWGAIASKTLHRHQVILCERPLFVADAASLFPQFGKLDSQSRDVALSLHANRPKPSVPLILAVWATNCFVVDKSRSGLFPVAARFNHACHSAQNVDFFYDSYRECLVLYVRAQEVAAGAELTITYGKGRTPLDLWDTYGFRCRCGACPGLSDGDVLHRKSQW